MSSQGPFLVTENHVVSILRSAVVLGRITKKEADSIITRLYWKKRTRKHSEGIDRMTRLSRDIGGLRGVFLYNLTKLQKQKYITPAMWAPIRPRLIDNTFVRGYLKKRQRIAAAAAAAAAAAVAAAPVAAAAAAPVAAAAAPQKRKRKEAVTPTKRKRRAVAAAPPPIVYSGKCIPYCGRNCKCNYP